MTNLTIEAFSNSMILVNNGLQSLSNQATGLMAMMGIVCGIMIAGIVLRKL